MTNPPLVPQSHKDFLRCSDAIEMQKINHFLATEGREKNKEKLMDDAGEPAPEDLTTEGLS